MADDFKITARDVATHWSTRQGADIIANVLRGFETHPARTFTVERTTGRFCQIEVRRDGKSLGWVQVGEKPNVLHKVYPSHSLEDAIRNAGHRCNCLWEIPGPPNTAIAWLAAFAVGKGVVIVQTYANHDRTRGEGWDAYTACGRNDIGTTVDDVLLRCGL